VTRALQTAKVEVLLVQVSMEWRNDPQAYEGLRQEERSKDRIQDPLGACPRKLQHPSAEGEARTLRVS
jgi:hypothetical protein